MADPYASRCDTAEAILPRIDPVIRASGPEPVRFLPRYATEYAELGYTVITEMFDVDETDRLAAEAHRLMNDRAARHSECAILEPGCSALRSIFDVGRFSELFARVIGDERLEGWARYILGDDVYVHQSRLNYKPGFEGQSFYWHSDFETWHVEDGMPRMRAISFSIALSHNLISNGPVLIIPGSHRQYVSCSGCTPDDNHLKSLRHQEAGVPSQGAICQLAGNTTITPVTGRAGDALIFDCNTMHGSASNITPYARTNLFVVYNAKSNRLQAPFSGMKPRPEWIAHRPHFDDDVTASPTVAD